MSSLLNGLCYIDQIQHETLSKYRYPNENVASTYANLAIFSDPSLAFEMKYYFTYGLFTNASENISNLNSNNPYTPLEREKCMVSLVLSFFFKIIQI